MSLASDFDQHSAVFHSGLTDLRDSASSLERAYATAAAALVECSRAVHTAATNVEKLQADLRAFAAQLNDAAGRLGRPDCFTVPDLTGQAVDRMGSWGQRIHNAARRSAGDAGVVMAQAARAGA